MAEVNKYSLKYTAVKRVLQGLMELPSNPSDDFISFFPASCYTKTPHLYSLAKVGIGRAACCYFWNWHDCEPEIHRYMLSKAPPAPQLV